MIHIFTDSTADLGPEIARRAGIRVIPLYVTMEGRLFRDGIDLSNLDLFASVERSKELPKTSAPSVGDFEEAFHQPGECIYIGISNRLSATVQNALLARESCGEERITVIDSLNLSTGIGLLALKAADLRDQGLPAAEIARQVTALVPKVRTSFTIETLDYLYKGGRCSAMQNLMGSLLKIRPVVAMRPDGTLGIKSKTRGSRGKALQALLDDFRENVDSIDLGRVFVTQTGCEEDAQYLKDELNKIAPIETILVTTAGSVISSHCGPGTIGILYLKR